MLKHDEGGSSKLQYSYDFYALGLVYTRLYLSTLHAPSEVWAVVHEKYSMYITNIGRGTCTQCLP